MGQEARNKTTMNLKKLLSKGHLVPIYQPLGEDLCLVGYRRKASSRKAHQRPFMLKQPLVIAKLPSKPETEEPIAHNNAEMVPETINKE